jgi:hypothetical protein
VPVEETPRALSAPELSAPELTAPELTAAELTAPEAEAGRPVGLVRAAR